MKKTHDSPKRRTLLKSVVVAAGAASLGVALIASEVPAFGAKDRREPQERTADDDAGIMGFLATDDLIGPDLWMQ